MRTDVIQRAARRLNGQEPMPAKKPDIREVVADVLSALIPEVERIVKEQVDLIEFESPADRTDEVLQAIGARSEETSPPQIDLSPLLEAIESIRQSDQTPQAPPSYEMRVTEFDSRNRPFKVEIKPNVGQSE